MKRLFPLIFLIAACGNSDVKQKLSGADSLVIQYYYPGGDSVTKTINTTQKTAISKLISFTASKKTERFKCGFDGNLVFYKGGQLLLPVVFKYRDKDCRHFLMQIDDQLLSTRLSGEAADFFTSLDEGRGYY